MASAGTRIVPVVVGNAIGTILSGRLISKSQRYKTLTLCAIGTALAGWVLILLRWNGRINIFESLYVVLPGFGMGTIQSSTFVHLAASLDRSDMAIAGTTWFLAQSMGYLTGASFSTALISAMLHLNLDHGLDGLDNKDEVCFQAFDPPPALTLSRLCDRLCQILRAYGTCQMQFKTLWPRRM